MLLDCCVDWSWKAIFTYRQWTTKEVNKGMLVISKALQPGEMQENMQDVEQSMDMSISENETMSTEKQCREAVHIGSAE